MGQKTLISFLLSSGLISSSPAAHYTYDALNRLIAVTDHIGKTLHYHYDAGGNLLEVEPIEGEPILVNLAQFTATPLAPQIRLEWQAPIESNQAGFNLWRAQLVGEQYTNLTQLNSHLIPTATDSVQPLATYCFEDLTARVGINYVYGLEAIDFQGLSTIHWEYLISATRPPQIP
ncbi:MAG: RHS repeat protein [Thioploca sp.]|nr:RHS repeat protein [Thioploca sp.]